MTTETLSYFEIASDLSPATAATFNDVRWEQYEQLIEELGEAAGLRVSYGEGTLEIVTLSSEHESYAAFISSPQRIPIVDCQLPISECSHPNAVLSIGNRKSFTRTLAP